jgi:hypothetical protein
MFYFFLKSTHTLFKGSQLQLPISENSILSNQQIEIQYHVQPSEVDLVEGVVDVGLSIVLMSFPIDAYERPTKGTNMIQMELKMFSVTTS